MNLARLARSKEERAARYAVQLQQNKILKLENDLFCSPTPYVERFARWVGGSADDIEDLARRAYR